MSPDVVDLLLAPAYEAVEYYLTKSGRGSISPESHILLDPGVRLYTSSIVRLALCFKYWDTEWTDVVPAIYKPGTKRGSAYRVTLGALLSRIDTLKITTDGREDTSNVGMLLRRLPRFTAASGGTAPIFGTLTATDLPGLIEACKKDIMKTEPIKHIKYFTDANLANNPPPGVKLRVAHPSISQALVSHPGVTIGTFVTPINSGPSLPPAATPADSITFQPSATATTLAPTTAQLLSSRVTGNNRRKMSKQDSAIARRKKQRVDEALPGIGFRCLRQPTSSSHQNVSSHMAALVYPAHSWGPSAVQLHLDQEWRCHNCAFKNPAQFVKNEDSQGNDEDPVTCSNCEEPHRQSEDLPSEDISCPECQEILPEGIPERERLFNPDLLKTHVLEWHSDYALAVSWRDQQKTVASGTVVCSFTTPTRLEKHLLVEHISTSEKRIPPKYLYAIARKTWVDDISSYRHYQLEALERRKFQAEDDALAAVSCELARLKKLFAEQCAENQEEDELDVKPEIG
ncbi:uncharacterized protein CcaverHIS019_0306030 [Cutaneotrichosporon cavernicola]|uniref:Uncharacterized protein n=1 Tax=Cutaneotrichosporon cavernicola TaxID=279322 RepID=A0AA48L2T9_9TREE|nr:uncharacterized protein CcaverHIS019_0306030 [Cutaneotrichosporon cavernicola]BEI90533.1 hypothetical protein CcaverHIS019_0306030 [Cutaneotrichosporon cavernicola]